MDRKKLAKSAGHSMGAVIRSRTLISASAKVARRPLDIGLMISHLAVDDGKAERQVDHHVTDARGDQGFRQAQPVEQISRPMPMMR